MYSNSRTGEVQIVATFVGQPMLKIKVFLVTILQLVLLGKLTPSILSESGLFLGFLLAILIVSMIFSIASAYLLEVVREAI